MALNAQKFNFPEYRRFSYPQKVIPILTHSLSKYFIAMDYVTSFELYNFFQRIFIYSLLVVL